MGDLLQLPLTGFGSVVCAAELSLGGAPSPQKGNSTDSSVLLGSTLGWGSTVNSTEGAAPGEHEHEPLHPFQSTGASAGSLHEPLPACALLVPGPAFARMALDGHASPCAHHAQSALTADAQPLSFSESTCTACPPSCPPSFHNPSYQNPLYSPASLAASMAMLRMPSQSGSQV